MNVSYEISAADNLICMSLAGTLDRDSILLVNTAFWHAYRPEFNRILMDYQNVIDVNMSVPEFTRMGVTAQESITPSDHMKAAYIAQRPVVFGFTRVIQNVWNSYLPIDVFRNTGDALEWLDMPRNLPDRFTLLSKG